MQPPIEHPRTDYIHDEQPDRPKLGWPALWIATVLAVLGLLAFIVQR